MNKIILILLACSVVGIHGQETPVEVDDQLLNHTFDGSLDNTELLLAFVVIRHGDRTPDNDELVLSPSTVPNEEVFFPYGTKALTNNGKLHSYQVGQYLRRRYNDLLSKLYLRDEVQVRTTNFERTKMTALCVLAGLYPPEELQQWHPSLMWQPIPYDTLPVETDDLHYWYNCPRYLWLRNQMYKMPDIQKRLKNYQDLFKTLSEYTKTNITTPEDVFYLDNLFQALANVGVAQPKWASALSPQIREMTKIEYGIEFYTDELIQIATGILMSDFVNDMAAIVDGAHIEPKMRIFSGHENNVAALMAAARAFRPHQPGYGSTVSLEFRKHIETGRYGVAVVYAPEPNKPEKVLKIMGCGDRDFCDYDTFLGLTKNILMKREDFLVRCPKLE